MADLPELGTMMLVHNRGHEQTHREIRLYGGPCLGSMPFPGAGRNAVEMDAYVVKDLGCYLCERVCAKE